RRLAGGGMAAKLAQVTQSARFFDTIDSRIWTAVRAHDTASAKLLVTGDGNDAADGLVSALTTFESAVRAEAQRANASFSSTQSLATWVMAVLGAVAVFLAAVLAFLISRGLVGGIRQLLAAAEGIAAGDVEQRIDVHSRDELGETADAFRGMVAYL